MSVAASHPTPTASLPFLPDLISYLSEWEARHAAAIHKTFLFVNPETHALWYAVQGTSPIHDVDTTLPEELADLAVRVRRSQQFDGVDLDARFILRDQDWQIEGMSEGLVEVRRDG
jgi:hypothetical protein